MTGPEFGKLAEYKPLLQESDRAEYLAKAHSDAVKRWEAGADQRAMARAMNGMIQRHQEERRMNPSLELADRIGQALAWANAQFEECSLTLAAQSEAELEAMESAKRQASRDAYVRVFGRQPGDWPHQLTWIRMMGRDVGVRP